MSYLKVTGHLTITSFDASKPQLDTVSREELIRQGHLKVEFEGDNLIVNGGLEGLAALVAFGVGSPSVGGEVVIDINDLQLVNMKIGNDGAPAAPTATDTALADGTPLVVLTSVTYTFPALGQVRARATIAPNTQNGEGLTEAGLFWNINSNDVMLGRLLISPAVVVNPGLSYHFDYDITFTAV